MYKLVMFDFDDTLIHLNVDWDHLRKRVIALARSRGEPADENEHVIPLTNSLTRIKEEVDGIFLEMERECVDAKDYVVFPKMIELVKELAPRYKLALISGNCNSTLEKALSDAGALDSFDIIMGRDAVLSNKPDPEPLRMAMEELSVGKEQALMVGNSFADELAAKAAGVAFYKVTDPQKDPERIRRILRP